MLQPSPFGSAGAGAARPAGEEGDGRDGGAGQADGAAGGPAAHRDGGSRPRPGASAARSGSSRRASAGDAAGATAATVAGGSGSSSAAGAATMGGEEEGGADGAPRPLAGGAGGVTALPPPAAAPSPAGAGAAAGPVRVALVIDDLGRSLADLDALQRLAVPVTYAVLPFESETPEVVATLRRRHEEILCHLPMEPRSGGNPGPGALRAAMSREELRQATLAALAAVPGAVGVNNHMGSGLSADAVPMATVLGVIGSQGLYYLDSRTSAQSLGFRLAGSLGIPAAERQVFLDDDLRPEAVAAQFQHLLDLARERGSAIAIGHPHPATLAALAAAVPRARALGYRFVPVSSLLDRPAR